MPQMILGDFLWKLSRFTFIIIVIRFNKELILNVQRHYKPTETFQYANFYSRHPPGVKKVVIKGEALRLLRNNSSQTIFEENIKNFENRLIERGYPAAIVKTYLSEGKQPFNRAINPHVKTRGRLLPFVTLYHPALRSLKKTLMG